jgi:hypothetical protein
MARLATLFGTLVHPGPWFMVAAGMALVSGDYLNATLLFVVSILWM